jgi:hypothetical protein
MEHTVSEPQPYAISQYPEMEVLKARDGAFTPVLLLAIGLMLVSALVITCLKAPVFKA